MSGLTAVVYALGEERCFQNFLNLIDYEVAVSFVLVDELVNLNNVLYVAVDDFVAVVNSV